MYCICCVSSPYRTQAMQQQVEVVANAGRARIGWLSKQVSIFFAWHLPYFTALETKSCYMQS